MAELAAAGKPSLLVPFAQATDDHQRKNADAFVAIGAAKMLLESELNPQRLIDTLQALLSNETALAAMGDSAKKLAHSRRSCRNRQHGERTCRRKEKRLRSIDLSR